MICKPGMDKIFLRQKSWLFECPFAENSSVKGYTTGTPSLRERLKQEKFYKFLGNTGKMLIFMECNTKYTFSGKISLFFGFTFDLLNSIYKCIFENC